MDTPSPRFVLIPDNSAGDERRAINPAHVTHLTEFMYQTTGRTVTRVHFNLEEFLEFEVSLEDALERLDPTPPYVQQLQADNRELETLYRLQDSRMTEATRRWRIAHPGNDLVQPDLGKVLDWLLAEIDKQDHA